MPVIIKRILRYLGWMLIVSGVLMAPFGCARGVAGVATWVGGVEADGVVTSIRKSQISGPPGTRSYSERSVISFTTAEGQWVSFSPPLGGRSAPYSMEEHVRVVYDADAPEDAVVPGILALLTVAWMLLFMAGVVLVLAGAGLLVLGALPWQSRADSGSGSGGKMGQGETSVDSALNEFARVTIAAIRMVGKRR